MNDLRKKAEGLLIAACASLVTDGRGEDTDFWVEGLREALPHLENCDPSLFSVRASARAFIDATPGRKRSNAWTRLRIEVAGYYRMAAAQRYDALKVARGRAGRCEDL